MVRLVIYLLGVALAASGLAWLADRPGTLQIAWQGYDIETSVFRAAVLLALAIAIAVFLWSICRTIWNSPAAVGERIVTRRKRRGLDALSSGMIAVGAGDKALATRYALQARKSLPHEPLTHLLRAQAAQLSGDRATARRIYEAMLTSPETEQLGLRGLFLEAEREGAPDAAQQFAGRAMKANPKLGWSCDALFDLQCRSKNWDGALESLAHAKRSGHHDKASGDRKRAILLAAKAQDLEEAETDIALSSALEAHTLAPELVPAAAVAGRILASRGQTGKAAKILQKTYTKSPHPDLATAYAHARVGDSARDRLDRIRQLAALNPHSIESPIAVATTAIEARLFDDARMALEPLLANRLTQRVATLMARIEAGENGDKGKVREWLARAVTAARDPVWIADGVISDQWEPISPIDGRLDAYQWRVPVEARDQARADIVSNRLEELLALGQPDEMAKAAVAGEGRPSHVADADVVTSVATRTHPVADPADKALSPVTENAPHLNRGTATTREPRGDGASREQPAAGRLIPRDDHSTVIAARGPDTRGQASSSQTAIAGSERGRGEPMPSKVAINGKLDSKLFVAPRAPDDPGPDDADDGTLAPVPLRPYRASK